MNSILTLFLYHGLYISIICIDFSFFFVFSFCFCFHYDIKYLFIWQFKLTWKLFVMHLEFLAHAYSEVCNERRILKICLVIKNFISSTPRNVHPKPIPVKWNGKIGWIRCNCPASLGKWLMGFSYLTFSTAIPLSLAIGTNELGFAFLTSLALRQFIVVTFIGGENAFVNYQAIIVVSFIFLQYWKSFMIRALRLLMTCLNSPYSRTNCLWHWSEHCLAGVAAAAVATNYSAIVADEPEFVRLAQKKFLAVAAIAVAIAATDFWSN